MINIQDVKERAFFSVEVIFLRLGLDVKSLVLRASNSIQGRNEKKNFCILLTRINQQNGLKQGFNALVTVK